MKSFIVPEMTFKGHSRSLVMVQFNRPHMPHITFYKLSVVTMYLSRTISEIFNLEYRHAL